MRLITFLALSLAAPGMALAQCFICDTVVELNDASAACFLENADGFIAAADKDPGRRTEVNLKICGGGRGLEAFPSLNSLAPQADAADNDQLVYFLDVERIECLQRLLDGAEIKGSVRIDLETECR
ncbi:hypothetical protein [Martelella endophytica]|uniref:Uncharacterized protein n=1 Tax=Martelella endophytica TaxID=1486262 RepID=A0A0D5LRG5_MAREN|nr:hypothetical protein [Martelella endophytica]AJY46829.1 hypothetical protein TM49_15970 [Martelella endophytica]